MHWACLGLCNFITIASLNISSFLLGFLWTSIHVSCVFLSMQANIFIEYQIAAVTPPDTSVTLEVTGDQM